MEPFKKAGLLTIPAELRNTIYEHALLRNERIDLNDSREPPGLLLACRQIRTETIAIYYEGNDFVYKVHDYDGVEAKKAFTLVRKFRPDDKKAIIVELCKNCTIVHICKLNRWLKAYHADPKAPFLRQDKLAEESDEQTLARRTFGVVQAMRGKRWEDVEEVLAPFYRAIDMWQSAKSEEELDDDESEERSEDDDDSDEEDESDAENVSS